MTRTPLPAVRLGTLATGIVLALAIPHAAIAAPAPAAGGVRLLAALESAAISAVGVVSGVERIDARAFGATLVVETPLVAGKPVDASIAEDTPIQFVWEERAPSRPARFANGDRILVALEPLPGDSVWLTRIPEPSARQRTFYIAERGDAFLRRPALGTVTILEHHLALSPRDRRGAAGVVQLANLARGAASPLALDAIGALGAIPALDAKLDRTTSAWLVEALVRTDATARVQQAMLELIAERRLRSLEPVLEERVRSTSARSRPDGSPELADPLVYAALAALDVEIDAATLTGLLEAAAPGHRLALVRASRDRATLRDLARNDADPSVRAAALERFVTLQPQSAAPTAIDALYDRDPIVRASAAAALARIGPAAVSDLRRVVNDDSQPAGVAAIHALREIQPEGTRALFEIAKTSPDESMRAAARLALGMELVEPH
ncbi:MAG: HEAT repeat domain-containing protein [Deltaproteobacteria bacterium]|nr:HEAT repeat domain-containing protein [Deltaproteobacteria bacterium]MBW2385298.1 HEAT repeat domain-containing protein [Deltaproteobacteria bacterium]